MVTGQAVVLYSRLHLVFSDMRKVRAIIIRGRDSRNAIIYLFYINILIIILNVLLFLAEYKLHYIQVSFKTVVYSVKLKLEFSVLNCLRLLTKQPKPIYHISSENMILPRDVYSSATLSEGHLNTLPGSSSETLPTLELSLSQFLPKFDI
ncbi:unnamed protein product [Penicillium roqueforti FM164]|uniref:Genomic scaffold, ProqFM164S02 n=1 Tax=Penicillium roqueforti (strain FM164) TaxID=1365484 RepID=W6Q8H2_PENRF|nr:unnamed protein product [Penicillium roqueforti FM164]